MPTDLRKEWEVAGLHSQLRQRLYGHQACPLLDLNVHPLVAHPRLLLEGITRQQVDHAVSPGRVGQGIFIDGEVVIRPTLLSVLLDYTSAGVYKRCNIPVAIHDSEVHGPEAIRGGVDGA